MEELLSKERYPITNWNESISNTYLKVMVKSFLTFFKIDFENSLNLDFLIFFPYVCM